MSVRAVAFIVASRWWVRRVRREIAPVAVPAAQSERKDRVCEVLVVPMTVVRAARGDLPAAGGAAAPAPPPRPAVSAPAAATPRCAPGSLGC